MRRRLRPKAKYQLEALESRLLLSTSAPILAPITDPQIPSSPETATALVAAETPTVSVTDALQSLTFQPNRGQTDAQIAFLARGSDYMLLLMNDGAAAELTGAGGDAVTATPVGANARPV